MLRTQVQDQLDNMKALGMNEVKVDAKGRMLELDLALAPEYATDKDQVKLVPCRECKRPMIVTTFFMADKAQCRECEGTSDGSFASVAAPTPGETDPSKAVNLANCLLNPQFAEVICPVCVEPMELKSVNHNDHFGPGKWVHSSKGSVWDQSAKGETVMHQCPGCMLVVTISNTARNHFKRINEPRPGKNSNVWAEITGVRDEAA
jgi:hypothetical protein